MPEPSDEDRVYLKQGNEVKPLFGRIVPGPDPRYLYLKRRDGLREIPLDNVALTRRAQT